MNVQTRPTTWTGAGILLALTVGTPTWADDTELMLVTPDAGGKLVLFSAVSVTGQDVQQMFGVGDLMREEAIEEANSRLDHFAARARNLAGIDPERVLREGTKPEEILKHIDEDEDIAILVLAASTGNEGPGPLVSSIAGASSGTFPIPITLVPGHLKDEDLDALT